MVNLYPYYLIGTKEANNAPVYTGGFTEGDTIAPALKKTEFSAYISGKELSFIIRLKDVQEKPEYIRLNFDPDHSGRRPHNLVQVTVSTEGECKAAKMEYDIVHLTPVDGVTSKYEKSDNEILIYVNIPLQLIRPKSGRRYIGFNMIRMCEGGSLSKWSGLPGELSIHCLQGVGDLIFTDGLSESQIAALVKEAVEDSNLYYTRWEKQKLPDEILKYATSKKNGFSLRIKEADVAAAKENAFNTKWGRAVSEHIFEIADYWASKSDDELYDLVPVGNPRAMTPSQFFGDPFTGGNRSTLATSLETPYRFYNKETGEWWYPGKVVKNPKTGEDITVTDNGEGFLQPEGFANPYTRCMLVAAYRNFILGTLMAAPYCPSVSEKDGIPGASGTKYTGAIPNLAYAFLLTDDIKYAYKAAILIGRIAELYPYMNGGYHDGSYSDTVHIEEPSTTGTEWKKSLLEAYDMIFNSIDLFHDEIKALFNRKPDAESKQRSHSFDLRRAVEQEMLPYVIYSCELERSGASDWSMRLLELEMEAAALIENGELLKQVLLDSKFSLFSKLRNGYYRDGKYAYDSSGYNEGMSVAMMNYPNWTYQFQDEVNFKEPLNLFEDKRFGITEGISFYYRYKNGSLSAAFGDIDVNNLSPVSDERKRGLIPYIAPSETAYRRMPSIRQMIGAALAAYTEEELEAMRIRAGVNGTRGVNYTFTLLAHALSPKELDEYRISKPVLQESCLMQDSEISILRSGTTPSDMKHLVLYGQPTLPHCHGDKLGLWLGAFGVHLLAFGGHYPYIWIGPKIRQWELHSASCNVVLIDGKDQMPSSSIQLEHFEGKWLQTAGMENIEAYPGSHYERWSSLIRTPDGENAYVLDQFMVSDGSIFDYNTHGLDVGHEAVRFEGVEEWTPLCGTLAGEEVPLYSQPGYGWMKAIKKAEVSGDVSWEYPYEGCSLKITALSNRGKRELYCCLGEKGGFEIKKSAWDTYVLLRDEQQAAAEHSTLFTTVMEPYSTKPFLKKIRAMELVSEYKGDFPPVGAEIVYREGDYRDILIFSRNGELVSYKDSKGILHSTDGCAVLIRYKGQELVLVEALGYTRVSSGSKQLLATCCTYNGIVEEADLDARRISVRFKGNMPDISELQNGVGLISSQEYKKPSPYYLRAPEIKDDLLTFYSDITLIRGEAGWRGTEKKRVQDGKPAVDYTGRKVIADIKPGDSFSIKNRALFTIG